MLFEKFEVPDLSHYSYAVGCKKAGGIAIVDPRRDVDIYLDFAKKNNVAITHVLETHIHADYASGARELVAKTGADLCLSAYDEGELFEIATPHCKLHDGDAITIGDVRIEVLHTPGHTPEHIAFLVYDEMRSKEVPMLMLSGDFLLVGSVGRPDLLGKEAKFTLAEKLFESTRNKIQGLPDSLEIYPAHGAGSMCGTGMSGRGMSTLGYERVVNPYLDSQLSKKEFLEKILGTVPPFPEYYKRMKRVNSEERPLLGSLPGNEAIDVERFHSLVNSGNIVIDLRVQQKYGEGHIPESFSIGAGNGLSTWAAWVVPYDQPILLVGEDDTDIESAIRGLVRVGLDNVKGYLKGGFSSWKEVQNPMGTTPQITPEVLHEQLKDSEVKLLDVRGVGEWDLCHIEGATNIIGGNLPMRAEELGDKSQPIAVICGGGYRSSVGTSVLKRAGFTNVMNVVGGMSAWNKLGLQTTKASSPEPS